MGTKGDVDVQRARGHHRTGGRGRRVTAGIGLIAALTASLLVSAAGTSAAADTGRGPVAEWSTVTGTDGRVYMADARGRALRLHGFNVKTTTPAATVTDELLARAAELGLDHLRLSYFWQFLEPEQGAYDRGYLEEIATVLDRAERHGILVIVSMHQDVFGEAFDSHGMPAWATRTDGHDFEPVDNWLMAYLQPSVQAAFEHLYEDEDLRRAQIDAWLTVVERVKDHPALLGYDLLNEPFGKMHEGEDLLTAAVRVERDQLTPMFQRLTDAISAVDPDHWVFFHPPNLASLGVPSSLGPVHGPKVAIYPHLYDPAIEMATYEPGQEVTGYDPVFFERWRTIADYVERNPMPLLVGEWGVAHPDNPGMDGYVANVLSTIDEIGSGWSVFNWCFGSGYCPVDADGNPRPAIGQIFRPYARAIAGAPTSTVWRDEARTLEVSFRADGRALDTDIFVSPDTYPEGWKVRSSAGDGSIDAVFDPDANVVSVRMTDHSGNVTLCLQPEGSTDPCPTTDPRDPDHPTTPTPPGGEPRPETPARPAPSAATPRPGRPSYTG